jgi:hypothetical protein
MAAVLVSVDRALCDFDKTFETIPDGLTVGVAALKLSATQLVQITSGVVCGLGVGEQALKFSIEIFEALDPIATGPALVKDHS